MADIVKKKWIHDIEEVKEDGTVVLGDQVAPMTFMECVIDANGNTFENKLANVEANVATRLATKVSEAPYDDQYYARFNGEWKVVPGTGGAIAAEDVTFDVTGTAIPAANDTVQKAIAYVAENAGGNVEVDGTTISKTADDKLQIKDGGVSADKLDADLKKKIEGKELIEEPATMLCTLQADGTYTSDPTEFEDGDVISLNVGDKLYDSNGDLLFTATTGNTDYEVELTDEYTINGTTTIPEGDHRIMQISVKKYVDKTYSKEEVDDLLGEKVDAVTGKGLSSNDYTDAEKAKIAALPDATSLETSLDGKVDKVTGKGLSTEDYATADKTKLAALPTNAELTASLDLKADKASPTLTGIPTAPTAAAGTNTTQIATTAFVTSSVEAETTARTSAIAAETSARTAADNTLTANLETLATKEANDVNGLQAQITAGVATSGTITMAAVMDGTTDYSAETDVAPSRHAVQSFVNAQDAQLETEIEDLAQEVDGLEDDLSELDAKVASMSVGKYYGYYSSAASLPAATAGMVVGYAYVGATSPFKVYNFDGATWSDSGSNISNVAIVPDGVTIEQDSNGKLKVSDSYKPIDATLSSTSANAVENKVIYAAIGDLTTLKTEEKTSIVSSANELKGNIGDLDDLKSENMKASPSALIGDDASIIGAINEIIIKSGQYDILGSIDLEIGEDGKYVNVEDGTTSNSAYAISSPVDLVQGNIYFFLPSSDIASPISLFAEYETYTQTVVDGYNIGADGEPDYNDPITHEDTIKTYKSLYNNPTGSRPESGFYVYTCDEAKQVVFSAKNADIDGAKVYYTRNGVISSLITQILNDPKAQVLVESIVTALARLDSFDSLVANGFAQLKAGIVDASELRIMGHKNVLSGSGAPSVLPDHIGQMYLDLVAKTTYIAYNTEAVSGWKEL